MNLSKTLEKEPEFSNNIININMDDYKHIRDMATNFKVIFNNYNKSAINYNTDCGRIGYIYEYILNKCLCTNLDKIYIYAKDFTFTSQEEKELFTVLLCDSELLYLKRFTDLNMNIDDNLANDYVLKDGYYCKKTPKRVSSKYKFTKDEYVYTEMIKGFGFYSSLLLKMENQVKDLRKRLARDIKSSRLNK